MKKIISLLLCLVLLISLCSCSGKAEQDVQTEAAVENTPAPTPLVNKVEEPQPTEEPEPEITELAFGETVDLDFVTFSIDEMKSGDELQYEGGVTMEPANTSNGFIWFKSSMKNLMGERFDYWKFVVKITIDDKYVYEGYVDSTWDSGLDPLESDSVFFYAAVPKELLDVYTKAVLTFGFNNEFGEWDKTDEIIPEKGEYIYQVTVEKE